MLNTPGHKGNANQNDPKISPLSIQNGYHENTNTNVGKDGGKTNSYTLLVGM
jgi:hypothetical protein